MDELIKLVTSKAGISEAQAKQAIETVMGFLKDKLPGPLAGQIDGLLKGNLGDVTKGLGGLLKK
ncbi:MAG: DUF2267 domain-containing protein [Anaerolineae bacterium]|nr:DUF2267 domain-containing protein [Anaerolineae bacterium]